MAYRFLSKAFRVDATLARHSEGLPTAPPAPEAEAVIGDLPGGWAIDPSLGRVLASAVAEGRRSVLEFGAGSSSELFAAALAATGGGRLTSIEQDPTWCAERWARVQGYAGVDAVLVPSTPSWRVGRIGVYAFHREAAAAVAARAPYDLVLVDAPQRYVGREGGMPLMYEHLADGALVVMDDARRAGERWAICKWLRTYPGLRLDHYDAAFGGRGIAVLRKQGNAAPRLSPAVFAVGAWQGVRLLHALRRRTPD